jgi:thiamine biosynthesis lipoprotein
MGSPCELLSEADSAGEAHELASLVAAEAWRIEDKYSRYIDNNIIGQINTSLGEVLSVDDETANLVDFAATLNGLSDGAFDVTSGVLRRVWTFDGSDNIPDAGAVEEILSLVGWQQVDWDSPNLRLPAGMEIDLGGIGKEYAVDRSVQILRDSCTTACLVNFGGDIAVTGAPHDRNAWAVGIEPASANNRPTLIQLARGALATSGDARRFLQKDGIRYCHVLDPRTGWPVIEAPSSVTVAADSCTQAGMLSTLAMLKGSAAETFLEDQVEQYWCSRGP